MSRAGPLTLLLASVWLAVASWPAGADTAPRPVCLNVGPSHCGLLGIAPQAEVDATGMETLRQGGVASIRLPLFWTEVEAFRPVYERPNWVGFDRAVGLAAAHGIRVLPFVWGTPGWVARQTRIEPVGTQHARSRWRAFLQRAVRRYGPSGSFWEQNPDIPRLPIRVWQIWNEPNIVPFSSRPDPVRYARLLRLSSRVISRIDPRARVIAAGLFGGEVGSPNINAPRFLDRVLRTGAGRIGGIAVHPYVADASQIRPRVTALRNVLKRHRRAAVPLWVTEMGWGSDANESQWERGLLGQAEELEQAMRMLTENRRAWRVASIHWFTLRDALGSCQFCDSAGLFDLAGAPKPAWFAFVRWAGGSVTAPESQASSLALSDSGVPASQVDKRLPGRFGLQG